MLKGTSGGFWSKLSSKKGQIWVQIKLLRALFSLVLKTSQEGDCTSCLGNLLQYLTFLLGKKLFLIPWLMFYIQTYAWCLSSSQHHCEDLGQSSWWPPHWCCQAAIMSTWSHLFSRLNKSSAPAPNRFSSPFFGCVSCSEELKGMQCIDVAQQELGGRTIPPHKLLAVLHQHSPGCHWPPLLPGPTPGAQAGLCLPGALSKASQPQPALVTAQPINHSPLSNFYPCIWLPTHPDRSVLRYKCCRHCQKPC